jgi:hypothetical protein
MSNVYTGDETWVYLDNHRTSMWIGPDLTRLLPVRGTVTSKKRMFWIDFSRTGIGAVVMLPAGQSFNKYLFAGTGSSSIVDDRALTRPKLKANHTYLHLDNARPPLTSDNYNKLGAKRRPHPPYGPDLAPCDCRRFGYPKHCPEGRFFDDNIILEGVVSEILMSIEPDMFVRVFAEWKHWLQQCIDEGGDYL